METKGAACVVATAHREPTVEHGAWSVGSNMKLLKPSWVSHNGECLNVCGSPVWTSWGLLLFAT